MSVGRLQRICRPDKQRQTMEESKGNLKSYCAMIGSMLIFGTIGIFRRYIPLSSGMLAFSRGLLGAAVFYAAVIILNKKTHVEDASEKTMIELFAASVVLLPYLLLTEDFSGIELSGGAVVMTLVVGIFHTGIAYAMYFGSLNRLRAQSVAVLSYIDPVFALLLSTLVLHEKMTVFGAVGSVMIIGSALVSELLPAGKSPSRS